MAPPISRRTLPPDPPDAGNRVSKPKPSTNKHGSISKSAHPASPSTEALRKAVALERTLEVSPDTLRDNTIPEHDKMNLTAIEPVFFENFYQPALSPVNSPRAQAEHKILLPEETHNRSSTSKNFRLASLDLDDPGPTEQSQLESLSYDDFPPLSNPMRDALMTSTENASQRIIEAEMIFSPITNLLDHEFRTSNPEIPVAHVKALKNLCEDLASVACRHFEAFIKGVSVVPATLGHLDGKTIGTNLHLSYASAANHTDQAIVVLLGI